MMRLIDTSDGNRDDIPLPKQHVEINPKHPVIVGIYDISKKEPALARVVAEQVYDNCLVAAGLLDDSRSMIPRLNDILLCVVNGAKAQQQVSTDDDSSSSSAPESASSETKKEEQK
jgi:TNF receptor-associated protein 1